MKYKLIIDKNAEEEITVIARSSSPLTEKIENLVRSYAGSNDIIIGHNEDEIRKLTFGEIECITVIDRKVTAIDRQGIRYIVRERLRDLEEILPS